MRSWFAVGSALVICLSLAACGAAPVTTSLPPGSPDAVPAAQATVLALAGARPSGDIPPHFQTYTRADVVRNAEDFDVNVYFKVLAQLAVEPGWVVDYLYRVDGMGGGPFVYARPADHAPYTSVEDYVAAAGDAVGASAGVGDRARDYLGHITIQDTREGYFQFVTLMLMGDQFYLFWHANYNDTTIVADNDALERMLEAAGSAFGGGGLPADTVSRARTLDLDPRVEFPDPSTAIVRLVTFSNWGGFIEHRYTIGRSFPHEVVDEELTTLIEYDCGVSF